MLSPYQLSVGVGLTASSFQLFSQLGAAQFGIMPLIVRDANRREAGLNVHQAVRVWDFFFTKATIPVTLSIAAQTIGYATAAYLQTPSTGRSLLWLAACTSFLPLPYTLTFILPSIRALQKISKRAHGESLSGQEEKFALEKLNEWNNRHYVRLGIFFTTFVVALSAVVPNLRL